MVSFFPVTVVKWIVNPDGSQNDRSPCGGCMNGPVGEVVLEDYKQRERERERERERMCE